MVSGDVNIQQIYIVNLDYFRAVHIFALGRRCEKKMMSVKIDMI